MISLVELVSICGMASLTAIGASHGLLRLRRSREQRSAPPMSVPKDESSGRPAAGAWHEPRYGKRHAVNCRIEYVLEKIRYEGMLIDMSKRGWRAQGTHPIAKGTAMTVQILCSDPGQCITIDEAVVRWTDGLEFGVEVTRINPESAARLSEYLMRHYPLEEPTPVYTLSPFSYN
jgi:PilZ domain